jgi:hypothetical protein
MSVLTGAKRIVEHHPGATKNPGQQHTKPLAVRSWTCTECGITHDRDLNAARTFWLKVAWSPPGWRRPKTLVEAASDPDLSQRLPAKGEPTKVPCEGTVGIPVIHGREDVNAVADSASANAACCR